MDQTPGMDIAQGAPADIGSLSPIVQLIKLIMGGGVPQQQAPMQSGAPEQSLRDRMMMDMRAKQLSGPGGMGY